METNSFGWTAPFINSGLNYQGTWDASANIPFLQSSVGTAGEYYIVSVAGTTNLNGVTDWNVGDWAIFDGNSNTWQKIDNHDVQAYNTIQKDGLNFPQRNIINFKGLGVSVSDDSGNNRTNVTIGAGGVAYGSWYDTTTQTASANTPKAMEYNTPDSANGFSIVNDSFGRPTKITAVNAGVYNVQFSAQTYRTSGGTTEQLWIWLRIDGNDVPNSATQITFKDNTNYQVLAWNFYVPLKAGSNCQLMWAVTDTRITFKSFTPSLPSVPDVPSVILTVGIV